MDLLEYNHSIISKHYIKKLYQNIISEHYKISNFLFAKVIFPVLPVGSVGTIGDCPAGLLVVKLQLSLVYVVEGHLFMHA